MPLCQADAEQTLRTSCYDYNGPQQLLRTPSTAQSQLKCYSNKVRKASVLADIALGKAAASMPQLLRHKQLLQY